MANQRPRTEWLGAGDKMAAFGNLYFFHQKLPKYTNKQEGTRG
jgi:hypothetical protein